MRYAHLLLLLVLLVAAAPVHAQFRNPDVRDDTRPALPSWPVHLIGASVGAGALGTLGWVVGEEEDENDFLQLFTRRSAGVIGVAAGAGLGAIMVYSSEGSAAEILGFFGGAFGAAGGVWVLAMRAENYSLDEVSTPMLLVIAGTTASLGAATGAYLGRWGRERVDARVMVAPLRASLHMRF